MTDMAEVERVAAVPLVELLEAIPADARLVWTEPDGLKATHYVPVGKYAHEAAELLRALANDLSRARDAIANCVVDRERLADERGSLAKDAERYRYIRAHSICGPGTHNYDPTQWKVGDPRPETMDAHIDAAIEAAGRTEGGGG
jgi:hypothetical protein